MKDLKIRTLTAIAILAIFLGIFQLGSQLSTLWMACITGLILYELYKGFQNIDITINFPLLITIFTLMTVNSFLHFTCRDIFIIGVLMIFVYYIFDEHEARLKNMMATLFVSTYVLFMGQPLYLYSPDNIKKYYLIFAITIGTDVFAYLGGMIFGRHKLAPKISPKKTIEGAVVGILGGLLLGCSVLYFQGILDFSTLDIKLILFVILASIAAELGDLFASRLKRNFGIKDFANLLPGHGGVLDRFDGVLFVCLVIHLFYTGVCI
ncbi:MAG: phosphatidate cytidylyltransferase [Tissierellia bacterium]|nr:phosphatidate cytidylyltransferase [Tissierellia bacterium]